MTNLRSVMSSRHSQNYRRIRKFEAGLRALRAAELRVIALTNGSTSTTKKTFEHAALDDFVDEIVAVDDLRHLPAREGGERRA